MGCTHTYVCCSRNSGTYRESRLATALFPAASLTGYEQIEFFVNDDTTYRGVSSDGPTNKAAILDDLFAFTRLKLSASSIVMLSSFFLHLLFRLPMLEYLARA